MLRLKYHTGNFNFETKKLKTNIIKLKKNNQDVIKMDIFCLKSIV